MSTKKTNENTRPPLADAIGSVLPPEITITIPAFMLWESARSHAMTSDDWSAAMKELERELRRETKEDGSTRVYEMIEACLERLAENDTVRSMTDAELSKDADCPLYPPNNQAEP